ncbi:aminoglycoside N(3)-acetyltransferase [Metabacillus iocasae]|uniref:Aminoglycoside N(3)-acetyltransferase n=1 Tax=Priestia iocasae TaxID=2291674 RepID=A0ABS2QVI1_9BACI|nr:AAC(3) family N-acetyltransferase [Metabacillus iocasae]MBM7703469.1 aminoglycoside 3-N-acetyltransferase [Metabacillus iocasae]
MKHIVETTDFPRTRESLREDFINIGLKKGMTVLVHTSLSSIGWVNGGSVAVIEALTDVVTEEGTIVMPSQSTNLSDPSEWGNPPVPESWWGTIRDTMPAYDKHYTPTIGMGRVVETFRTYPGVVRSDHPAYSFVAWGKEKNAIINHHSLHFGLGEQSPLGVLDKLEAFVLLLGASFENTTAFHLAEYRIPYRTEVQKEAPIIENGKRVWKTYRELSFREELFEDIGADFLQVGDMKVGKVGSARTYLFSFSEAVRYAEKWLTRYDK